MVFLKRVLIADDDMGFRSFAREVLTRQGYEVTTADDGEEALAQAALHEPDLILIEALLPKKDGFEVCEELKRMKQPLSSVPVVMVIDSDSPIAKRLGKMIGAHHHLKKPCSEQALINVARELIGAPSVRPTVLVVDDERRLVQLLTDLMEEQGYQVITAHDGDEALAKVEEMPPDLILMDIEMPRMSGLEVTRRLKNQSRTMFIPIVIITAMGNLGSKIQAIEAGADDFINKPYSEVEVVARAKSLVRVKQLTDQLDRAEHVLFSFARTVEAKDAYTEKHTQRVTAFALSLAKRIGCSDTQLAALRKGAILHDVGKIGIRYEILNKPGKLTPEEFEIMKQHPVIGWEILKSLRSIQDALPIVRWHHERLDGSGYPDGLKGDEIPMAVQVMTVADIFDAMSSTRPYRDAMPREKCFEIMRQEAQKGWRNIDLVEVFIDMTLKSGEPEATPELSGAVPPQVAASADKP